ncbi:MAG: hypothetical protein IJ891_03205 [Prevotella sp.]|nr:hypothetical protein [Prevotella sp.]
MKDMSLFFIENWAKFHKRTETLKDVREIKHVLVLFRSIDEPAFHVCFLAFSDVYISSQATTAEVEKYKKELERHQSEKSDEGYAIAINKTHHYLCYLGQLKPKFVPQDYKSRRMDENILADVIRDRASAFNRRRHGFLCSMIREGLCGNGYEKMTPEDYSKMLDDHNISHSSSRSSLYLYLVGDCLSHSMDIKEFDDKISSLQETDLHKRNKLFKDVKFCSGLVDTYWQKITK